MNPLIKCTNWEIENKEQFTFIGQSYLHYEAEDLCGYDCVEGDLDFCRNLLKLNIFKAKLLLEFDREVEVLVIPYIKEHRVCSLICLCTDEKGIENALSVKKYINTCIEESDKIYLFNKYPHIQKLIKQYNYAK